MASRREMMVVKDDNGNSCKCLMVKIQSCIGAAYLLEV